MAVILATSDSDLWAVLGTLTAMITAIAWWNRRDLARAIADRASAESERSEDFGLQDEGWQH